MRWALVLGTTIAIVVTLTFLNLITVEPKTNAQVFSTGGDTIVMLVPGEHEFTHGDRATITDPIEDTGFTVTVSYFDDSVSSTVINATVDDAENISDLTPDVLLELTFSDSTMFRELFQ